MEILLIWLLLVLQSFLTLVVVYRLTITLCSIFAEEKPWQDLSAKTHFAVIIPAHNEELTVKHAVSSVLRTNYPVELKDVFVIADNCTDRTAEVARECGVFSLERSDSRKGKGYALQWAMEQIPKRRYDAFVFLDADSTASPSLLSHLDNELQDGKKAIQGYEGTQNPNDSWMTRLSDFSDFLQFRYYFRGRSKLGLSCRLLGNGMCFSKHLIENVPWNSFSITENWEYYMNLILAGYSVHYDPRAKIFSQRAVDFKQGKAQRVRWIAGRAEVARKYIPALIISGIRNKDFRKIEAAIDFLLPSQSMLLGMLFLAVFFQWWIRNEALFVWLIGITTLEASYIGVGAVKGRFGYKTYGALLFAPLYIMWKLSLRAQAFLRRERRWVKTERRMSSAGSKADKT